MVGSGDTVKKSRREKRSWTVGRKVGAVVAAFAVGCLPTARIVTRLATGRSITTMGNGQPGASNVRRTVGTMAGVAVGVGDVGKGLLPALAGRLAGADPDTVGMLAVAPIAAHILVGGGHGAAPGLGAVVVWDPLATSVLVAPVLVAGWITKKHAPSALVCYVLWAPVRRLLGRSSRSQVAQGVGWGAMMMAARLRGPHLGASQVSSRVLWQRLVWDREASPVDGGGVRDAEASG